MVANAKELAGLEACTEQETFALLVAAWLHDTGYIHTDIGLNWKELLKMQIVAIESGMTTLFKAESYS
ncbi:hypothetical protein OS188_07515 [Xanthomarina sp. F1114]|uniref:hypothetical protein n=1 Tax=Xanthomarina sp. F1114 TaxID=2996019 RepID=UPI00225DFA7D|nr:hypothetical protein [Xanthomarina sp. F1114]MCX7547796.1 hypothetical protein [Xanthomarina sp. F1114]